MCEEEEEETAAWQKPIYTSSLLQADAMARFVDFACHPDTHKPGLGELMIVTYTSQGTVQRFGRVLPLLANMICRLLCNDLLQQHARMQTYGSLRQEKPGVRIKTQEAYSKHSKWSRSSI